MQDSILTIEKYYFWLMVYSFIGWVYESILCSVRSKSFINRGFLNGPYCPIYGFGALIDIIMLGWIENPLLLFLFGMFLTCTLEYLTSYIMEKLFHARWWDYKDRKFNINGRICLLGAVVFGTFSLLLIKFIHPFIINLTNKVPYPLFNYVCAGMFLIFAIDNVLTISGFIGFSKKLHELSSNLEQAYAEFKNNIETNYGEFKNNMETKVQSSAAYEKINEIYSKFEKTLNSQQLRMIKAFPKLREIDHEKLTSDLREHIIRRKNNLKK